MKMSLLEMAKIAMKANIRHVKKGVRENLLLRDRIPVKNGNLKKIAKNLRVINEEWACVASPILG